MLFHSLLTSIPDKYARCNQINWHLLLLPVLFLSLVPLWIFWHLTISIHCISFHSFSSGRHCTSFSLISARSHFHFKCSTCANLHSWYSFLTFCLTDFVNIVIFHTIFGNDRNPTLTSSPFLSPVVLNRELFFNREINLKFHFQIRTYMMFFFVEEFE